MIDPLLSLVFTLHSNKGIYALLIGSGVSRPAGIPTGWEVVLDLIRKLARLKGETCEPDPAAWYQQTYGIEPDYSDLLNKIVKTPVERSQILKSYFEPTEEERIEGFKVPVEAHQAIAQLVAKGYIRIIVTTNFDRLLERAIEACGVIPTVISNADAAEGALPITHSKCSIIKVHGDYLDTRMKNTATELSEYGERMSQLLDQIFDEYGLIVCGWSGQWDTALRAAIERCRNQRFSTYWASKDEPSKEARKLINLRRAEVMAIKDANSLFAELEDKLLALEDISRSHPLSAKIAVASLKRYIVDDKEIIRLYDLVCEETERLHSQLNESNFPAQGIQFSKEELLSRIQRYEAMTEILVALMSMGCFWGGVQHQKIWAKCLERVAHPNGARDGLPFWIGLKSYPALLLFYAAGIGSVAGHRYDTLSTLMTKVRIRELNDVKPLVLSLYVWAVIPDDVGHQLPGMEKRKFPGSDYLFNMLREPLRDLLPDDSEYQRVFDQFEYLLALVYADFHEKEGRGFRAPIGCFGWRSTSWMATHEGHPSKVVESEIADQGANWPLVKAGLFDRSVERVKVVKTALDQIVRQVAGV